jgi:hypothetical protein
MRYRIVFVLSLFISLPLLAQTQDVIAKFDSAGAPIDSIMFEKNGKIGINTNDPKVSFHMFAGATSDVYAGMGPDPSFGGGPAFNMGYSGASYGRASGFLNVRPDALAVAPNPSLRFLTADVMRMIITNTGTVGIGTSAPAARLHIEADTFNPGAGQSAILIKSANTQDAILGMGAGPSWSDNIDGFVIGYNGNSGVGRGFIGTRPTTGTGQINFAVKNVTEMTLTSTGLTVTDTLNVGNIVATGSITGATVIGAVYQDVAEWVPATTNIDAGTVVVLNRAKSNEVMASTRAYDTSVAGVVSAQPGILLGIEGVGKEQIATTGRVKVRVDARVNPVLVGDLLVTSDTPGTAMRSEPMSINGRAFHQPGTIIGKALEPLEDGVGEILVLLSMQ